MNLAPVNKPKQKSIAKYLHVNTKFRPYVKGTQPNATNFLLDLPYTISNVVSMKLKSMIIPNTEYAFDLSQKNNCFRIFDASNSDGVDICVPPGNYTIDSMIAMVNTNLKAKGITDIELMYNIASDPSGVTSLKQFHFAQTPYINNDISFDLDFNVCPEQRIENTLGWVLGFHKPYYSHKIPEINIGGPTSCNYICLENKNKGLVGAPIKYNVTDSSFTMGFFADEPKANFENIFSLPTSSYYLLSINDYVNNGDVAFIDACLPSNVINDPNIIAKIPSKYADTFYNVYNDLDEVVKRVYSGPVDLKRLQIRLYNDNNRIVNLNNADYSFLLELEVLQ
jgi:hypothetical protein